MPLASKFLSLVSSVHALYFMEDVLILTSLSEFWENWTEDLKWGAYDVDGGVFQQTDGFISRTLWVSTGPVTGQWHAFINTIFYSLFCTSKECLINVIFNYFQILL